ncbi:NAD(P)-dependent oxidoreductase [Herbaspirillum sp. LeCh32-8]|uniref:NAD-dependent epimerase/dehydratase family protein n=1 Tax=Herbaspirillum sp. LeCh32-8 TaxID=2821356 RepID=UPI001AE42549|nr:NAD(P)-dependent oxidoreductase [Herbaspirillum sp. LeCh32-8]MBP0598375.1 NAD(P)-dependent oxidoreductase [Herbaspirillum sp. LeCh32-8]
MRIALLGASSQIARDLAPLFAREADVELTRFVRDLEADAAWRRIAGADNVPAALPLADFDTAGSFDAVINFIGAGDPARAAALGKSILDITRQYDELVMSYLQRHPACRYLFLSSGAAYGADFEQPADVSTPASFPINDLGAQHWYGLAKFHAECRHRASPELAIADIRVFSYISRNLDIDSRFLVTDIARALASDQTLSTSRQDIMRDYICPEDLFALMRSVLAAAPANVALDCYSRAPVGKMQLLEHLAAQLGLRHALIDAPAGVNATGLKPNYFSNHRKAAQFGYSPRFDSLTAVTDAIGHILSQSRKNDV